MANAMGNEFVRGDTSPIPNKGTGTGVENNYGADISVTATNKQGALSGADSDPAEQCKTKDERI
jgi:hypothetical protein